MHTPTETSLPPGAPATEPMRVLLVEDDEGDALLVEEELALAGAPVALTRARTLAEAVTADLGAFDCVLLDLELPDAAGLEALRALRAQAPGLAVLVLTGLDDGVRGVEAVAAGAQEYLVKGSTGGALLARALRHAIERRRAELIARQLSIAQLEARENSRLERGLLPAPLVSDPTLTLALHYRPGRRRSLLGGDFYDAVQMPDGTVHAVIGDVSGHGPDEAAVGVCLRIAWRTLVLAGAAPDELLGHVQAVLRVERHAPQVFATLCMVSLAPDRRSLDLRLAGHPPPLLITGEGAEALELGQHGPPLGVLDDARWTASHVTLPESWSLLLFTDGVMDGRVGPGPERLGEAGLIDVVLEARAGSIQAPRELVRLVVERAEDLNDGPLSDDVALLLIDRRP